MKWLFEFYKDNIKKISPSTPIQNNSLYLSKILCAACRSSFVGSSTGSAGRSHYYREINGGYQKDTEWNKNRIEIIDELSRLEVVKWLVSTYSFESDDIYRAIKYTRDCRCFDMRSFKYACTSGNLTIARFLFKKFKLASCDIDYYGPYCPTFGNIMASHTNNLNIFVESCWINCEGTSINNGNISNQSQMKLNISIREKAQLEVVKWLVKKFNFPSEKGKIVRILDEICSTSKKYISPKIVKWLVQKFDLKASDMGLCFQLDKEKLNYSILRETCQYKQFGVARYLIEWFVKRREIIPLRYSSNGKKYVIEIDDQTKRTVVTSIKNVVTDKKYLEYPIRLNIKTILWLVNTLNLTSHDICDILIGQKIGNNIRDSAEALSGVRCQHPCIINIINKTIENLIDGLDLTTCELCEVLSRQLGQIIQVV